MTEEEAIKKAEFLIDKGYVENTDVKQLAAKILKGINNGNADHEAATSTRSEQP
jgi:hypothetical protein